MPSDRDPPASASPEPWLRLSTTATRRDLVLAPSVRVELERISAAVRASSPDTRGQAVLFSGAPGPGRTQAAKVLANALQRDLYRIDLARVVSKYIGETEKNLRRAFAAAEKANAILFFDEADALFGKRTDVKDSHDKYANQEVSYLLQRIETFKGLAILATNRKQNLDPAFVRRLRFVVDFEPAAVAK
jgi:SpoVK/Ycf46/Vps4 family AAA+-type ATPase